MVEWRNIEGRENGTWNISVKIGLAWEIAVVKIEEDTVIYIYIYMWDMGLRFFILF